MDRLIKRFDAVPDEDLMLCERQGVAYQRNMARGRMEYGEQYFANYRALASTSIGTALNAARMAMLEEHFPERCSVLDVGVGSGAFLEAAQFSGYAVKGLDVNPVAISWMKEASLFAEESGRGNFSVVTFWDSLEHMDSPGQFLRRLQPGVGVLVALPLFDDLRTVRESKHYKPGEHLYYWTERGFINYMALYGFRLLGRSNHEVQCGRESIGAFAFKRDLPTYRDYVGAYKTLHSSRHYGDSATELHLGIVADLVRANRPNSILDYGCGRSDIAAHFWLDGRRRIARYDPAIPGISEMPEGKFDLVLCCDVLEHIPMEGVDRVLQEVKEKGDLIFFTISLKLAKARLPDGTNAHCTLLTRSEWEGWLKDVFGKITVLPARAPHELLILTGEGVVKRRHPACQCGGEVHMDSHNPVKKPVEWYMRCVKCNGIGEIAQTEQMAERRWNALPISRRA